MGLRIPCLPMSAEGSPRERRPGSCAPMCRRTRTRCRLDVPRQRARLFPQVAPRPVELTLRRASRGRRRRDQVSSAVHWDCQPGSGDPHARSALSSSCIQFERVSQPYAAGVTASLSPPPWPLTLARAISRMFTTPGTASDMLASARPGFATQRDCEGEQRDQTTYATPAALSCRSGPAGGPDRRHRDSYGVAGGRSVLHL